MKESAAFIAGCQAQGPSGADWFMFKRSELPTGFQGKVFKDRMREGSRRGASSTHGHSSDCLVGADIINLLIPIGLGSM